MSEMKYTPGPWIVIAGDDYMVFSDATPEVYPHRCDGDDLGRFVAQVGNRGHSLGKHDADLIAAAPDMLEALKRADQFMTNGVELGYIRLPTAPDSALQTPSIVRAAIAKASGAQP